MLAQPFRFKTIQSEPCSSTFFSFSTGIETLSSMARPQFVLSSETYSLQLLTRLISLYRYENRYRQSGNPTLQRPSHLLHTPPYHLKMRYLPTRCCPKMLAEVQASVATKQQPVAAGSCAPCKQPRYAQPPLTALCRPPSRSKLAPPMRCPKAIRLRTMMAPQACL